MSDISSLLKKKKITHTHSTNEIIVSSSTKKEITSIIDSLIDNASRDILLDIVEAKKSVYIRKKTK